MRKRGDVDSESSYRVIEGSLFAGDEQHVGPHGIQVVMRQFRSGAEGLHESAEIAGVSLVIQTIREVLDHRVYFTRCRGA